MYPQNKLKLSKLGWLVLGFVIVLILLIGFRFKNKFIGIFTTPSGYQAVFLTNGQVYFGSISDVDSNYVILKDIYYLQQANPSIQGNAQKVQPLSLIKLGRELHGPKDIMYINHAQILFYEDLRPDSDVLKKIQEYKASQK